MVIVNSVKDDVFEQALQTRDVKEFANVILNYKDDVVKGDFILNFHGVSFTTEDCEFTNDFLRNNKDALFKLDEILEKEEMDKNSVVEINIDKLLEDYAKGIRDYDAKATNFYLNGTPGFDARKTELKNKIEELKKAEDINNLDLTEKEEMAKQAVDNAKVFPEFDTIKEAVDIVDALNESEAKSILLESLISFINDNITTFEEKEEIDNILSNHQINSELKELEKELEKIEKEIAKRKKTANSYLKAFKEIRKSRKSTKTQKSNSEDEPNNDISEIKETHESEIVVENTNNNESNQDYISKLESIANEGPIFQDLDLTAGYSLGAYRAAVAKKEAAKKEEAITSEIEENIYDIIPELKKEIKDIIKNKVRKVTNITKAPVALIKKITQIDYKAKIKAGLGKIKELATEFSEYVNIAAAELSNEYYIQKKKYATEKVAKYSQMEKTADSVIASRGFNR